MVERDTIEIQGAGPLVIVVGRKKAGHPCRTGISTEADVRASLTKLGSQGSVMGYNFIHWC